MAHMRVQVVHGSWRQASRTCLQEPHARRSPSPEHSDGGRRSSWGFVANLPAAAEVRAYAAARATLATAEAEQQMSRTGHPALSSREADNPEGDGAAASAAHGWPAALPTAGGAGQALVSDTGAPSSPGPPGAPPLQPGHAARRPAVEQATAASAAAGFSGSPPPQPCAHLGGGAAGAAPPRAEAPPATQLLPPLGEEEEEAAPPAAQRPPLLAALEGSRLFHCPDAVQAVADAQGAGHLLHGMQAPPPPPLSSGFLRTQAHMHLPTCTQRLHKMYK